MKHTGLNRGVLNSLAFSVMTSKFTNSTYLLRHDLLVNQLALLSSEIISCSTLFRNLFIIINRNILLAWLTSEIVLKFTQSMRSSFLCNGIGLKTDWVRSFGHWPVSQISKHIWWMTSIMLSPPHLYNSAGMPSCPGAFPLFNFLTAATISDRKRGDSFLFSRMLFSTDYCKWLPLLILGSEYNSEQYSFHLSMTELCSVKISPCLFWV